MFIVPVTISFPGDQPGLMANVSRRQLIAEKPAGSLPG
jgi:hypothetical protein